MIVFERLIVLCCKFFIVGLILHFFLHTIVQYGLGVTTPTVFLLWKEILATFLFLLGFGFALYRFDVFRFFSCRSRFFYLFILLFFLVWTIFVHFFVYHGSVSVRLLSVKYDFFPLFVVLSGVGISFLISEHSRLILFDWFVRVLKIVLVVSLVWYVWLYFFPHILSLFGYSLDAYQWEYGFAPPLHYLQHIWSGTIRNQGLFGGPVSWWFFLTAFWPFYLRSLLWKWRISNNKIFFRRFWVVLYLLNVWLCYSRGAWLAVIFETLILCVWHYKRRWRQIVLTFLFAILAASVILLWKNSSLFARNLSDSGHVDHVLQWVRLIADSPWLGYGWWTAGPASYRSLWDDFFNPENQYIQIAVEYGLIWLILRLALYVLLIDKAVFFSENRNGSDDIFFSVRRSLTLWLLGLAVSGLFLHPAVDSQVMYILMFFFGLLTFHDHAVWS